MIESPSSGAKWTMPSEPPTLKPRATNASNAIRGQPYPVASPLTGLVNSVKLSLESVTSTPPPMVVPVVECAYPNSRSADNVKCPRSPSSGSAAAAWLATAVDATTIVHAAVRPMRSPRVGATLGKGACGVKLTSVNAAWVACGGRVSRAASACARAPSPWRGRLRLARGGASPCGAARLRFGRGGLRLGRGGLRLGRGGFALRRRASLCARRASPCVATPSPRRRQASARGRPACAPAPARAAPGRRSSDRRRLPAAPASAGGRGRREQRRARAWPARRAASAGPIARAAKLTLERADVARVERGDVRRLAARAEQPLRRAPSGRAGPRRARRRRRRCRRAAARRARCARGSTPRPRSIACAAAARSTAAAARARSARLWNGRSPAPGG